MTVYTANKGICIAVVRVYGKAVHSSFALTNHGCNAIDYAAKIIVKIREFGEEFRKSGTHDKDYVVPHTTMSTNLIKGGNAVNTVPAECEFSFEFSGVPPHATRFLQFRVQSYIDNELLPALRAEYPDGQIDVNIASSADEAARRLLPPSCETLFVTCASAGSSFTPCGEEGVKVKSMPHLRHLVMQHIFNGLGGEKSHL
ncbi:putative glutamamyl carboxypeptidase, putative,metallo-peptidase, clan MH, family M18 [Trypanosoma grayi]|uniref:putative glutamamyl carboxypeptidase, putative,metallo-peptidase, clan MH, family M18 n=1 Tax=Trypanosoma grayi TaxID=71804 RepID=UPI0004F4B806|nr:putative glutamamyl carboxypeptidase, putative,metallo-peptidase, clan MH, family M18 [Trypanosoma grayi]KEG07611.1 putative glutamamyl carboxypeptidase, putative,metallo-peptidase, clan MH, family M18 [Trypanosoma grayi]